MTILEWVAFARCPLALEELEEAVAVDLHASPLPRYVVDRKPLNKKHILEICAGLFQVGYFNANEWGLPTSEKDVRFFVRRSVIRFSHFSVGEYLCSERLRKANGQISRYGLYARDANLHIAECCLAYALHGQGLVRGWCGFGAFLRAPLYDFAVGYFSYHCRYAGEGGLIVPLAKQWLMTNYSEPLVEAAMMGMFRTVSSLLSTEAVNIDAIGCDRYGLFRGTALYFASAKGHTETVQVLLRNGADATMTGSSEVNPLQVAVKSGNVEVVKLFLKETLSNPADTASSNLLQGNDGFVTLFWAVWVGSYSITQSLIGNGAILKSLSDERYAVLMARARGNAAIMDLLSKRVDPNQNLS